MGINRILVFFLLFFVFLLSIYPEQLQFKYVKGEKYKIITTSEVNVYLNAEFDHTLETLYKIAVDIIEVKEKSGFISALFSTSEKGEKDDALYALKDEDIAVTYWCNELGQYSSKSEQLLPQVRDIPLFPEKNLEIGDSWEATGKQIIDLSTIGFAEPIIVPLSVSYVYIKNETINEIKCAVFRIYYTFNLNLGKYGNITEDRPVKITGYSNQRYSFDIVNGRAYAYEDTFSTLYFFLSGDIYEFKGQSHGEVIEGTQLNKDKMVKEIEDVIKKEGIKDTTVKKEIDGIKITLENINFLPESDILLPSEQEKLQQIGKILQNYPDKDFFISGHTALAGSVESQQELSEKRAQAVGEYLLYMGVCKDTQLSYKGFGARVPLGDNSTPDGMKKNRRVEIKILEN